MTGEELLRLVWTGMKANHLAGLEMPVTLDELYQLGEVPVLLADSHYGLAIRFDPDQIIGVQVPGEENIRWIALADLVNCGSGALMQIR